MALSECHLIKNSLEYVAAEDTRLVPAKIRGLYVLYQQTPGKESSRVRFDVVYVGMARGKASGIAGRLHSHRRDPKKRDLWTHFSVYEVWDNVSEEEVEELEGLFRHLFRYDSTANALATQKAYKPLQAVAKRSRVTWIERFPA